MIELFYKITGGRPMTIIDPHYFTDIVSGEAVMLCSDHFNRNWLATNKWGWFRVATERR